MAALFPTVFCRSRADPVKILFINQYYWPDSAATAQILTDLGEHLAKHGHEVHVLCSRGQYDQGSHAGLRTRKREVRNGVHVRRIRATGFGKKSLLAQAMDFASFHLLVGLRTLLVGWRYDVIVTLTTPPLIGIYATPVTLLTRGRTRHVVWVMDLHPDCEYALGVLDPRKKLPRFLDWLNTLQLRKASACAALGECMAELLVRKGVAPQRVRTLRLWGLGEQGGDVRPEINPVRTDLGLQGKFIVSYSGNAGIVHAFEEICAAALALRDDPQIVFLFIGGGRRMGEIKAFKEKHKLANIRVMGYFPREQLRYSLALADVHLISLRPGMAGTVVPSKLYGIMAAGRPAIYIGPAQSETARTIRRLDCGRTIDNGAAAALLATLRELARDETLRRKFGRNARAAFESEFNAQTCGEQWRQFLEGL